MTTPDNLVARYSLRDPAKVSTTPDHSDLVTKGNALHLAWRQLNDAIEKEGQMRKSHDIAENKFITENFIALNAKTISVKAYDEKKKFVLFQFKLDHNVAKTILYKARAEYNARQESLNILKKLISIQ